MSLSTARSELQALADSIALGVGRPEAASAIATRALAEGLDGPALVSLAGSEDLRSVELEELMAEVCQDLGLLCGSPTDALVRLAALRAAEILQNTKTEIDGASEIWDLSTASAGSPPASLHTFIYAASEWSERPTMHDEFRRAIRAAASALIASSQ